MGSCKTWNINQIDENWRFIGEINSQYDSSISFGKLSGNMSIRERNSKKEIFIKGLITNKNKKKIKIEKEFSLHGFESRISKDKNIIYFNIKDKYMIFNDDLVMIKDGIETAKISGKFYYDNKLLKLYLELYLIKPKKEKSFITISSGFSLSKLTDDIDIISNSVCGLKNLGNTCYFNSSFQILIHIPKFVKIIKDNDDFRENIIEDINLIFKEILRLKKENMPLINPSKLVNRFKYENQEYNNYFQKDSEQFLEDLLWNINLALGVTDDKRKSIPFNCTTVKEKLFWDYIKQSEEDTYYKINDLFYVCFVHEKKCEKCGYLTYYFDESCGLKLNFEKIKYKSTIDLYSLIMDNFKNPIRIESSMLCQKCMDCYNIIETTRIAKLPSILILALQKTNDENTEKFPWSVMHNEIGIKEIVDLDLSKFGKASYEIFAINNHLGHSPRGGHYYSTIFLEKLYSWYSFNDSSVEKINKPTPSINNYILFYKQK